MTKTQQLLFICVIASLITLLAEQSPGYESSELHVPAFTAYLDPSPNGASVNKNGIIGWNEPATKVLWYGEIKMPGKLNCAVTLKLTANAVSKLRMTVAGQSNEVSINGAGTNLVTINFGAFNIPSHGYQQFALESLNGPGKPAGDLESLILSGPAVKNAHFNLKERRNAASVHLSYPVPDDIKVEAFYCEVTALEDPLWTYYMACGWQRGYLGMQVNSPTERRIIFSVWDGGKWEKSRETVEKENHSTLIAKGDGVFSGVFGNEGTGGHSHLKYMWKTGEVQRFIVTAKPVDATYTIYSGFYFHPEKKEWILISSWKAPKDGAYLQGLYSFSENFGDSNGHLRRKALFGNQWIRTDKGKWTEITEASFSHDETGAADRLDRFMGMEKGQFFLSQGGFVTGFTKYGEKFIRPSTGKPPVITIPSLPPEPKQK